MLPHFLGESNTFAQSSGVREGRSESAQVIKSAPVI